MCILYKIQGRWSRTLHLPVGAPGNPFAGPTQRRKVSPAQRRRIAEEGVVFNTWRDWVKAWGEGTLRLIEPFTVLPIPLRLSSEAQTTRTVQNARRMPRTHWKKLLPERQLQYLVYDYAGTPRAVNSLSRAATEHKSYDTIRRSYGMQTVYIERQTKKVREVQT